MTSTGARYDALNTPAYPAELIDSRFIRRDDPFYTEIPKGFEGRYEFVVIHTWDRKYEYRFAVPFVQEGSTVADIGVGTFHPYVYFLGTKCRKVYAVDLEPKIKDLLAGQPSIEPLVVNFAEVDQHIPDPLDTVFSISALEHMEPDDLAAGFRGIHKLLKPGGLLVATFDVLSNDFPNKWNMHAAKGPEQILTLAFVAGFKPVGDVAYHFDPSRDICKNVDITRKTEAWLACYRTVLIK